MKRPGKLSRVVVISLCLGWATAACVAQGGPPGPGMGGPQGQGGPRGAGPGQQGQPPDGRAGYHLGPPGRWWDDPAFASGLRIRPEQRARMDAIFEQSRAGLVANFDAVRQAETQMDQLARAATPDEAALDAGIDRVSQARAALEKTNTHMLLMLRKELDAEQIRELEPMRMLQQMRKGLDAEHPGRPDQMRPR